MFPSDSRPQGWKQFLELARSDELDMLLRARLVELAFTQTTTTATKAIELLWGGSFEAEDDGLGDIPSEVLLAAREAARGYITARADSENGHGDGESPTGEASYD